MRQVLAKLEVTGPFSRMRTARRDCLAVWLLGFAAISAPVLSAAPRCSASAELEGALVSDPSPSAYNTKGEYFAEKGDSTCAVLAFRNALRLDGESWAPRYNLGRVHLGNGQLGEALAHLQIAADARPDHLDVRMALGSVLLALGHLERAAREFTAAVETAPRSIEARQRLAKALLEQGRYVAAIDQIELALGIDPDAPDSLLLLGTAHSRDGHPERAIAPLERLVRTKPDHFAGHFNLAAAYAQQDRYSEASQHFTVAMDLDPLHSMARLSAAKAEVNLRNFQGALELTEPWVGATPESVDGFEVHYLRGIALRALSNFPDAEAALRRAVKANADSAEARQALGELLAQRELFAEAREHLQHARKVNPDSQQIRFALISVLRELADSDALRTESESFEERKREIQREGLAVRLAGRAAAYLSKGDAVAALRGYEQALGHDSRDANLHYGRALALSALDRHAERIDSLGTAIELDPALAAAHNELGLAFGNLERPPEAEAAFRAAIKADPQYAAARGNLGVLCLTQGRHAEAEALFRRAVEDDPGSSHMRVNHGLALAALDHFEDAERAVREAKRINPADAKADRALALIERLRVNDSSKTLRTPK